MTRGRVERRLMRARAKGHVVAPTVRTMHAGSTGELTSILRAASWWNTSRRKRLRIELADATFHTRVELVDGIDLVGEGTIVWDGLGDTILTHGADSTLAGIGVRNTGPRGYAIHADAPCRSSRLRLHGVRAESFASPAHGAGLFGGQTVEAHGSTFTSRSYAAVHLHPWLRQSAPAAAHFTECRASSPDVGVLWNQLDSGQPDELRWTGIIDAPSPLEAVTPPPVLVFSS